MLSIEGDTSQSLKYCGMRIADWGIIILGVLEMEDKTEFLQIHIASFKFGVNPET
jgi:hypothetical protein